VHYADNGRVLAWGRNANGQCGACLEHSNISAPRAVEGLKHVQARRIACGAYHSLVVTAGASDAEKTSGLFSFGWNNFGQLGLPTAKAAHGQATGEGAESAGSSSSKAFDFIDAVNHHVGHPQHVCFGGRLLGAVEHVAAGGWHSLCAMRSGEVLAWGCNDEVRPSKPKP
jgi:alpha-tubulin suppressor-like RCC1 family protein